MEVADHKILDGRKVAEEMKAGVAEDVKALKDAGWAPNLISITVGESEPIKIYVRNQRRVAESVGIGFEERQFPTDISRAELHAAIGTMNADPGRPG